MFKTISRLLFGGVEEEVSEDVRSGEGPEEEWLVVTHQEAGPAEHQEEVLEDTPQSNSTLNGTAGDMGSECVLDPSVQTSSSSTTTSKALSGSFSQPKTLTEMTKLTCIQKAKAWADRHHVSRNAFQRQNRVRQGVPPHAFPLQQPGHRSFSH